MRRQTREALPWPWLGDQQLGCERLPGADQPQPDRITCIPWYRPEPVKALVQITHKAVGLTESLGSPRCLAPAKYPKSPFQMLMVPLDSLLHGFPRDVLDVRKHSGESGRVGRGFVGGHRVRRHPGVLESGAKERGRGCRVALLLKQHLDDLSVFINGPVDIPPSARPLSHTFHRPTSAGPPGADALLLRPDTREQTSGPSRRR
jgi:hypothetical protein